MHVDILTLFPHIFRPFKTYSMWEKAISTGALSLNIWDLRSFSKSKQYKVDAPPFGGGQGMVLRCEPLFSAVEQIRTASSRLIYFSPRGKRLDNALAKAYALEEAHYILLCGHYEGIDERVITAKVDEEVSIGDYVLTGGEIASAVFIDAVIRFLPGVLGNELSPLEDSFATGLLEHPHYTRPARYCRMDVPEVLLTGRHQDIAEWRKRMSLEITRKHRPDLLK